jgi:hypothetical protein
MASGSGTSSTMNGSANHGMTGSSSGSTGSSSRPAAAVGLPNC